MNKIVFSSLGALVLISIGTSIYFLKTDKTNFELSDDFDLNNKVFLKGAKTLESSWRYGVQEPVLRCLHYFSEQRFNLEQSRCYAQFFSCFYQNQILKVKIDNQAFDLKVSFPKSKNQSFQILNHSSGLIPKRVGSALKVELSLLDDSRILLLPNKCNQVKLAPGVYGLGEFKKRKDFLWDNFKREILIDKFLVTKKDVLSWFGQIDDPRFLTLKKQWPKSFYFKPETGLKLDEMKSYCHYHGKTLLKAKYLDAASFYREEGSSRPYFLRGPYPWTKSRDQSVVKKLKINRFDCMKLPAKGCEKALTTFDLQKSATTWSGVFQVLGGVPEAVVNTRYPRRNLSLSSLYLPWGSQFHRIGKRIYWDGKDFFRGNFSFGLSGEEDFSWPSRLPVGFRCVEES